MPDVRAPVADFFFAVVRLPRFRAFAFGARAIRAAAALGGTLEIGTNAITMGDVGVVPRTGVITEDGE